MARGPNRAPGRFVVPMSNGAPTIATSGRHESSCSTSVRNGRCPNDATPGVGQLELLGHPRRKFALMFVIVIVAHALDRTVPCLRRGPSRRLNRTRYGLDAQRK